jgi:hypothetical protein
VGVFSRGSIPLPPFFGKGEEGAIVPSKEPVFGPLGVSTGPEGFLDGGFSLSVVFSFFHRFRSELRFVYLE